MKHRHRFDLFSLLFVLFACGSSSPEIKGFDRDAWKNDQNGCASKRLQLSDAVLATKEKLLGLGEIDIVSVLGNPDQQELYSRNQKFYRYYLEPNGKCAGVQSAHPKMLVVRFNAVGLAKEINLE
jgi:hypothetical protein